MVEKIVTVILSWTALARLAPHIPVILTAPIDATSNDTLECGNIGSWIDWATTYSNKFIVSLVSLYVVAKLIRLSITTHHFVKTQVPHHVASTWAQLFKNLLA